jgi:hypothetical protein
MLVKIFVLINKYFRCSLRVIDVDGNLGAKYYASEGRHIFSSRTLIINDEVSNEGTCILRILF